MTDPAVQDPLIRHDLAGLPHLLIQVGMDERLLAFFAVLSRPEPRVAVPASNGLDARVTI